MKTYNDTAFNPDVFLFKEPNLNSSFLEQQQKEESSSTLNPRCKNYEEKPEGKNKRGGTYTLEKPENQVLKKQNQTKEEIVSERLIKIKEETEKGTYNGLGHDPLNFGARHGCSGSRGEGLGFERIPKQESRVM